MSVSRVRRVIVHANLGGRLGHDWIVT
jgi:hypothetical protein